MADSPYTNERDSWRATTEKLVSKFPLSKDYLVNTVLSCWKRILNIELEEGLPVRKIKPQPQMMGFFLHALFAHHLAVDDPENWRPEKSPSDKDVVNTKDINFSFEIKTSSDPNHIYGNRSYAQAGNSSKKTKSGYYLAVNFEKFSCDKDPEIVLIRFGWLDHDDWAGQASATGQQARLDAFTEQNKLLTIYDRRSRDGKGSLICPLSS